MHIQGDITMKRYYTQGVFDSNKKLDYFYLARHFYSTSLTYRKQKQKLFFPHWKRSASEVGQSLQRAAWTYQGNPSWGAECTNGQAIKRKKGENDKHKDIEHLSLMMVLCIESELLASSQVTEQHPPVTAVWPRGHTLCPSKWDSALWLTGS